MSNKIDVREALHTVIGMLRRNEIINAYDLLSKMSKQMDDEYYGIASKKLNMSSMYGKSCLPPPENV